MDGGIECGITSIQIVSVSYRREHPGDSGYNIFIRKSRVPMRRPSFRLIRDNGQSCRTLMAIANCRGSLSTHAKSLSGKPGFDTAAPTQPTVSRTGSMCCGSAVSFRAICDLHTVWTQLSLWDSQLYQLSLCMRVPLYQPAGQQPCIQQVVCS